MKRILMIAFCAAIAGCTPGEATLKLSAENVRRALKGEIVEIPVHAKVEMECPLTSMFDKVEKCPVCQTKTLAPTNCLSMLDSSHCAAANALTVLLADGSCVTGGMKVVGTNVVYWGIVDTKFLFGTETALRAASNRVAQCNGCVLIDNGGEIHIHSFRRAPDHCTAKEKGWVPSAPRIERIIDAFHVLSKGCQCCGRAGDSVVELLDIKDYESISLVFDGDGKEGFRIETGKDRINSENIGTGYKCMLAEKADKADGIGRVVKPVRLIPVEH